MTSSSSKNLAERHLLITGASSGIGLSLLHEALTDGAECAVIVKDSTEADAVAKLLPTGRIHIADLRDVANVAPVTRKAIASLDGIVNGLACCAGAFELRGALEHTRTAGQSINATV